jgi:hypothetical protein
LVAPYRAIQQKNLRGGSRSTASNSPNECALVRAAFAAAIAEKPAARFMIRSRIRVVKRHPEGDW